MDTLPTVATRSKAIGHHRYPEIVWEHSHVVVGEDGTPKSFCVYDAPSEEVVREHVQAAGRPLRRDDLGDRRRRVARRLPAHRRPGQVRHGLVRRAIDVGLDMCANACAITSCLHAGSCGVAARRRRRARAPAVERDGVILGPPAPGLVAPPATSSSAARSCSPASRQWWASASCDWPVGRRGEEARHRRVAFAPRAPAGSV